MKEVFRTNNPVEISYVLHCLAEAGIEGIELDRHTSVVEGSIGAIQRRIMVIDEDFDAAVQLINGLDVK
ncbi:MAG: DUF2007 domain-containing protein [Pseudomonadota bacterium]